MIVSVCYCDCCYCDCICNNSCCYCRCRRCIVVIVVIVIVVSGHLAQCIKGSHDVKPQKSIVAFIVEIVLVVVIPQQLCCKGTNDYSVGCLVGCQSGVAKTFVVGRSTCRWLAGGPGAHLPGARGPT